MKKNRLTKVLLIFFVVALLGITYINFYGKFNGSVSRKHYESLKNTYDNEVKRLSELNRELKSQLSGIKEKLNEIGEYIDFIGLPIDSSDKSIHNEMRITKATEDHYGLVIDLIDYINQNYPKIKLLTEQFHVSPLVVFEGSSV